MVSVVVAPSGCPNVIPDSPSGSLMSRHLSSVQRHIVLPEGLCRYHRVSAPLRLNRMTSPTFVPEPILLDIHARSYSYRVPPLP